MDGSDCRGYRTTRRNLPSSIAYRPPFTAISRNIGVIDMQTSHTTASAAATTSLARRIVAASWKPVLFAVLMWLSAAAGEIPIPGTPVPITLQTFVVMLAGLMLPWRQAGAAVATYGWGALAQQLGHLPAGRRFHGDLEVAHGRAS